MQKNSAFWKIGMVFCLWVGCFAIAHSAGDPVAGHEKANGCASCHGIKGKGRIPLAGKKAAYLEDQLRAFKTGVRKEQMMNMMAKSLSDQDIEDLAAYFSAQ